MRIPSGVTDQYIAFAAVDASDLVTPETGLSSFTVYRSRNGGAATAFTTPTITEASAANMPGWYWLLLDEDMTIDAGDHSQMVALYITASGMAPVRLEYEIYRPDVTAGETVTVSGGAVSTVTTATNVTTVNGMAAGVITAAAIATGAIDADAIATDAVTEIQSGLMLAASYTAPLSSAGTRSALGLASANLDTQLAKLDTIDDFLDTEVAAIKAVTDQFNFTSGHVMADVRYWEGNTDVAAGVRLALGMTSANLDAQIGTLATASALAVVDDFLDTEIAAIKAKTDLIPASPAAVGDIPTADITAIKAKTDSLAFTVAGQVDANIQYVNDVQVNGTGAAGNEWGP